MLHTLRWQLLLVSMGVVVGVTALAQDQQPAADPFVQGVELVRAGRYQEGEQLLQQVVEQSPENQPAWFYLGVARFRQGNDSGALEAFVKARDLARGRPGPTYYIGQIYERQGAYEEALRAYEKELTLRRGRREGEIYCAIGRVYALLGRFDEAIDALRKAMNMEENFVEAMYWLGRVYTATGQYEDAEKVLNHAREVLMDWSSAKSRLEREPIIYEPQFVSELNEPKVAQEYHWAEQFAAVLSMWPELNKARGDLYMAWHRWTDARNAYRKALQRDEHGNPDDPDVFVRVARAYLYDAKDVFEKEGLVYTSYGVTREAIKTANEALKRNEKLADAYCVLGDIYLFEATTYRPSPKRKIEPHSFKDAVEQYKQALSLNPDLVDAMVGLANALVSLSEQQAEGSPEATEAVAEAIRHLEKAVTLAPNRADVHAQLARAYLAADRLDECLAEAEQAIRLDSSNVLALNTAGTAYYMRRRLALAAEYYSRAKDVDPANAETLINLGNTYFQMKSWYRAREAYRQALEHTPSSIITNAAMKRARIYYLIALCYDHTLNFDREIDALSQAIFLDDTFVDAYLQLAKAYAAKQDYRAAEQALRIAAQKSSMDEDRLRAYIQLGETLEQAGKYHDAVAAYTAAANIDPTNPLVQEALQRLRTQAQVPRG